MYEVHLNLNFTTTVSDNLFPEWPRLQTPRARRGAPAGLAR